MKTKLILVVLILASLACSTLVPTATATSTVKPTATAYPTATKTKIPAIAPEPAKSTPTPEVDQCIDLENQAFVYNDNVILEGFGVLNDNAMSHFPGNGVIIMEGLPQDAAKIREVYDQIAALETPPYYKPYHDLELSFFETYVTALDAAIKGNEGKAFIYLEKTWRIFDQLNAEILRLQIECPLPNSSQTT